MRTPHIIKLETIRDPSGSLTAFEQGAVPFPIARVFILHDVVEGGERGGHAHHVLQELIVAVSGSFTVSTQDERGWHQWTLNRASEGLWVPPGVWRRLTDFSGNAIALVLASTPYDPADYIRDHAEFVSSLPPLGENVHDAIYLAAGKAYDDEMARTGNREAAADARTRVFATEYEHQEPYFVREEKNGRQDDCDSKGRG
jgi:hypothetical protein